MGMRASAVFKSISMPKNVRHEVGLTVLWSASGTPIKRHKCLNELREYNHSRKDSPTKRKSSNTLITFFTE